MVAKGTSGEAAGASTPAVPAAAAPPDGLGKRPERMEEAEGALAETAEPVAEADAPGGGAAAEAASAVTKKTAEEASLPADPGATVDALRKEANDRIETVQPDGSFASKSALERFKASPDLVQGESTFKFEKCTPKALLYARESTPCTDGISHLITYAAVAPRPLTCESPEPIKGAVMPFMAVQLNTRSYGVAGESRDVIFCTIVENDTGCNAVVYDIESKKCTEHLMWRVVGGREIEATVEMKTAAQLSYIEWHKEKIKGFTSGDNARASRAAAAAAAAKEKERERDAAASKPAKSGVGKNKASGDEADGDDEVAPVDPPPVKLLKLTRSEARVMFATKTSVHQRKKSEDSNGYRTRLHAACKAFGKKSPETSRNIDCQEFLMKALGLAEPEDDGTPAGPPPGPADDPSSGSGNGSSSGSTAGSSSGSAAQLETKGWTRTPCSESGAFYYVHSDGRVQWEVPEEMQPKPKKLKPSGPPPSTAFGGAPVPTPAAESAGHMQLAVAGSGHGGGGSGDASMEWLSGMQRSGATINLTVVQRGAYENAVIYQQQPGSQQQQQQQHAPMAPYQLALSTPKPAPFQTPLQQQLAPCGVQPQQMHPPVQQPQQAQHMQQQQQAQHMQQQQQAQHPQQHIAGAPPSQHAFYQ